MPACTVHQRLKFRDHGFFSHGCELNTGSVFGGGRCEHRMVSQDVTGEGECCQSLSKGPPTKHDTVPRRDVTKGRRTSKCTHEVPPKRPDRAWYGATTRRDKR